MGAGRPPKQGLSYHGSRTDKYEDFEMVALLNEYGPKGALIYDVIFKKVLGQGYYLEIPMDILVLSVIKTIGNKWIKNKDFVLRVIQYCADLGLFDKDLLQRSVITSVEIQRSYAIATARNKVQMEKYRLLEKESEKPLLNAPKKGIDVTENRINVTEIQNSESEIPIKERKLNKEYIGAFGDQSLESAFQLYLIVRSQNWGEISEEQIQAMREELLSISNDVKEQIAIVKKATAGGWKNFYPINKGRKKKEPVKKKAEAGLIERDYDMDSLEVRLLKAQETGGKEEHESNRTDN